jgi:hypothetical protein
MRIFKQMDIDFKSDILFKDTLDYIDGALGKLGICYDSMGFMYDFGDNTKVTAKYPVLAKYIKTVDERGREATEAMSSARTDENGNYALRVDESEHQILHELVKKTPRPFSFGAIAVFWITSVGFPKLTLHRVWQDADRPVPIFRLLICRTVLPC